MVLRKEIKTSKKRKTFSHILSFGGWIRSLKWYMKTKRDARKLKRKSYLFFKGEVNGIASGICAKG